MSTVSKLMFLIVFIVTNSLFEVSLCSLLSTGNFDQDFFVTWAPTHVNTSVDGKIRTLKLDQVSGSGFESNKMFLFGRIDMKIKLVPGYSAGTVLAFYLSSNQPNRDEIDFEFLGNVTGQPYILQTNIYADGFDNREERIYLWFDPTKDFHNYSILWNPNQIVFMVDWIPIRVYRNHADKGVAYPRSQPMSIKASLWNGEMWATRGGKDKIEWTKGPFIASFGEYKIDGCEWKGNARYCRAENDGNWFNKASYSTLTDIQRRWFKWVRLHHLIYDYCEDNERFNYNLPKECHLSKY